MQEIYNIDINNLLNLFLSHILVEYLLAFLGVAYLLKGTIFAILNSTVAKKILKSGVSAKYCVWIISTLVAIPFCLMVEPDYMKLFVTYCTGTILYDLFLIRFEAPIKRAIKKIRGKKK